MSEEELDIAIKEYNGNYRYYQRLIAIWIINEGHIFAKKALIIEKSYQTVH